MRTISLFTRVPLLLAAVAASHLPAACVHAAAATNTGPTEVAGIRTKPKSASPSNRAVAFYYPWYGNPATDGHYANWNHPVAVRDEPPRSYPGGDDIGSNFYPSRGCYSVNDPEVLREHNQRGDDGNKLVSIRARAPVESSPNLSLEARVRENRKRRPDLNRPW